MPSIIDKKFAKVWQSLKKNTEVKSSPWFKKADAAVSEKLEAYQEAFVKAQSGLVADLLALGKALRDLEQALVKFVDAKALRQISDSEVKKTGNETLAAAISRCKAEVQHGRTVFESRLKSALSAVDHDLKKLESIEAGKKKELWKGFGIDL
jgi:hypothetical protein